MKKIMCCLFVCGAATCAQGEALRVCSADNEMPYANERGEGFEDRIARVLAQEMGMAVERVGFSDPRHVVRDLLDKGLCDVMIGVDTGDPRLATTGSYYSSGYVFVTRADDPNPVRDWDSEYLKTARIGVVPATPAETMLRQIGRYSDMFRYLMALGGNRSPRNRYVRYDTEKLIRDVASGEIDVAVAWAPSVARYVKSSPVPLRATPVAAEARRSNGDTVRFRYDTSVGVRKGEEALLRKVEAALASARPRIDEILQAEGITPLSATSSVGKAKPDSDSKG